MKTEEIDVAGVGGAVSDSTEAAPAGRVEHLSMAERAALGKAAREAVPRSSHGVWEPGPGRRDPVELLEEQAATRVAGAGADPVRPDVGVAVHVLPGGGVGDGGRLGCYARTSLHVQLCGDAHLSNFGAFAAPDRRLVFSVNDFDETLPGPFEWDVKRLVASFAVAGRDRGFDAAVRESVNLTVARAYRQTMRDFATMGTLDVWYARVDLDELRKQWAARVNRADLKRFDRNEAKARAKDSLRARRQADPGRRRRGPDRQRPAADRPHRRAVASRPARRVRGVGPHHAAGLSTHPAG